MTMDNPLYMPKGWRSGATRLGPTVAHQESGGTYVKARAVPQAQQQALKAAPPAKDQGSSS